MLIKLFLASLFSVTLTVQAQSIEPGRISTFAVNDYTQFNVFFVNSFDEPTTFKIEAFADRELTKVIPIKAFPPRVRLNKDQRRKISVGVSTPNDKFYICTTTIDAANRGLGFETRTCSSVRVYR